MTKVGHQIVARLEMLENNIKCIEIDAEDFQCIAYRLASLLMRSALRSRKADGAE